MNRIQKVAYYIYSNFNEEIVISVSDFILKKIDDFSIFIKKDKDWISDNLIESSHRNHAEIIKELNNIINSSQPRSKIILEQKISDTYIRFSNFGKSINYDIQKEYSKILDKLLLVSNNSLKGKIFENFCILLLRDLNIKTYATKSSNDKGIDIVGELLNDNDELKFKYLFHENVLLLCQCKFYNNTIDTPVIRKLVGDSLFIRFSELDYLKVRHNALHLLVISYNGFSQPAKEFSNRNKVKILEGKDIISIAASIPNLKKSRSYRYLNYINDEMNKNKI